MQAEGEKKIRNRWRGHIKKKMVNEDMIKTKKRNGRDRTKHKVKRLHTREKIQTISVERCSAGLR